MMVRMHGEDDTLIPGGWLFCLKVHGLTACMKGVYHNHNYSNSKINAS